MTQLLSMTTTHKFPSLEEEHEAEAGQGGPPHRGVGVEPPHLGLDATVVFEDVRIHVAPALSLDLYNVDRVRKYAGKKLRIISKSFHFRGVN